jgi:hypothetical protein
MFDLSHINAAVNHATLARICQVFTMHKLFYPSLKNGTSFCVPSTCVMHISSMASLAKQLTSTLFVSQRQLYKCIGSTNTERILRTLLAWHDMNGSPCLTTTLVAPSCNG